MFLIGWVETCGLKCEKQHGTGRERERERERERVEERRQGIKGGEEVKRRQKEQGKPVTQNVRTTLTTR
jgi:hypothetical protein